MDRDFLDAIRQDPDDNMVRLVWADYLEESGDPRGDFIRIQCELAQLPEYDRGRRWYQRIEDYYLDNYRLEWLDPIIRLGVTAAQFRRGLPEVITIRIKEFLENAEQLCEMLPSLHTIRFSDLSENLSNLQRLGSHPLLTIIRGLDLSNSHLSVDQMQAIQGWPQLPLLEYCDLSDNLALEQTLESPCIFVLRHPLKELHLRSVELRRHMIEDVVNHHPPPYLTKLKILDLSWSSCSLDEIRLFYEWGICDELNDVRFAGNAQVAASTHEVAQAVQQYRWKVLDLSQSLLDEHQIWSLSQADLSSLEVLKLSKNPIRSVGARTLASTETLKNLKYLDVSECMIQLDGVRELYASEVLRDAEIEVSGNHLNVFEWSRLKTEFGERVRR